MKELRIRLEEPPESGRNNNRSVGKIYERQAAAYYQSIGYRIIAQNYQTRSGEIDLIASKGRQLVFCEVKYRSSFDNWSPLEAVHAKKRHKIIQTARYYLMRNPHHENDAIRFDVIGINAAGKVTHIKNAFDLYD